jgi:beta-galactosidase/beta-glucuronidase
VLTTLIARGVYPDPDHGLDNMAIPDSLSRQDYWYRSEFMAPAVLAGRHLELRFNGINYAAEIWMNGARLGDVRGAFTRGLFDVTNAVHAGAANAIAVRISPPPHPGIPHEQSVAAGPGNNGGSMALDGPTFIAAEGWDWIPGIRDRNTGIWQSVELRATGALRLRDPHIITHLPLPRTDTADITFIVPVENRGAAVEGTVTVRIAGATVRKKALFSPGTTSVTLAASEFPQLHLASPRLWWPNGYGSPELYTARMEVGDEHTVSDSREQRIGIRELSYDLSLFDHRGRLQRVTVDPTLAAPRGERLVDTRHEAIKRSPWGWAQSLTPAGEASRAVQAVPSESLTPYLAIRVNGVLIAARGGSWGMDDSRKRISRGKLEPYFRLERDANLNIIRNWLGQNTEDVFYELADEYGFLVLNDFWVSTQEFQLEPQDAALFLANAGDVISRYRNHPSIAVWFGRNEGVPPPLLNEGLDRLIATLDGTRLYTGSSNEVNLQGSGPYNYRDPEKYFTELARGFSVEVGTPSLATLEALRASIPAVDGWPLNDTYAYHDWHFGGNGDVATFMSAMAEQYGAGSSLEDFERKAQLMDYVSYRAIFEGFNAHLWSQNSGRLLWMTHPSWPSNTWQIYSSDYDTAAAYYAVKKACEPLHVQMNLPDFALAVVNTTRLDARRLTLKSRVWSLDNRLLFERVDRLDARADAVTTLPAPLPLTALLNHEGVVLVKLSVMDARGSIVSDNLYWQGENPAAQQRLNDLQPQHVSMTARFVGAGGTETPSETRVDVILENMGSAPALNAKMTVLDGGGDRVLPVSYADNYVTLLPGEMRHIEVRCPTASVHCSRITLRGWNVMQTESAIAPAALR